MSTPRLVAFDGALRRDSWNRKVLAVAIEGARRAGAEVTQFLLRDLELPLYDGDLEAASGLPEGARRLKAAMIASDGFLLGCPEYNTSITGVLKNAIDWTSRSEPGEGALLAYRGKIAALSSASPGAFGGLRSLLAVRTILSGIGVLVLPTQVAVPRVHEAFDEQGQLKDPKQKAALEALGAAAVDLARKLRA